MAYAIRDFRYFDFEKRQSVEVHKGDEVHDIAPHVDMEKLGRTKYVDLTAEGTARARKVKRSRK